MKQKTLEHANRIASGMSELRSHKKELEAAMEANKGHLSPFTNTLGLLRNNGNSPIRLRSAYLPMNADKILDLYIREVDEVLATTQSSLDNLTDDNCPE